MKHVDKLSPITKLCMTIGNLPASYLISLTYEEQLLWLCDYLKNTVIPAVNNNAEAVEELQSFIETLDLQEEVDKKIEEMYEDGTLQEIITQYLQIKGLLTFNNVNDLKLSSNLINGSVAKTLGYHNPNDDGSALYLIRNIVNTDIIDNATIIALNDENLVAEMIYDKSNINIKSFGAYGNNINDDLNVLNNAIDKVNDGGIIYLPSGSYILSDTLNINKAIILQGCSTTKSNGSILKFNNTNGLTLKQNYIKVKNISILALNKPEASTIDIDNKNYGIIGINLEYTDSFKNGGCIIEECNVSGFNTGIGIYSSMTSNKWSGAYRSFINTLVTYCDIGYLVIDGATFNKINGGNISSCSKHAIYCTTDNFYNELEVIGTALEVNGNTASFDNNLYTDCGLYVGSNSKVKFTNSYLEKMSVYVKYGSAIFESCHIHANVPMFGLGSIICNNSIAPFSNIIGFSTDFTSRTTNTNLVVNSPYGDSPIIRIQCDNTGENRINMPNILSIPTPIKDIEAIKIDFDVKVNNGYQISNFGIKPELQLVGYGNNNTDSLTIPNTYPVKNLAVEPNKWEHITFIWRPRKDASHLSSPEDIIYRLSTYIFFNNLSSSAGSSDFTINNLDMFLANFNYTIYSKNMNSLNPDINYIKSL